MKRGLICLTLFVIMLVCSVNTAESFASVDSLDTNVKAPQAVKESLNSLGVKVKANTILKSFPYVLNRCDEVAVVEAKYIPDFEDYTKRENAYFVLNAFQISMFKDQNAENLLQTTLLADTKILPQNLRGARGCVIIDGGVSGQKMALCTENQKNADNILGVLKKLYDCRGGLVNYNKDDVKKIDVAQLKKILKSCGLGKFKNVKDLTKKLNELEKKKKFQPNFTPNVYFHPGGNKVPGTA